MIIFLRYCSKVFFSKHGKVVKVEISINSTCDLHWFRSFLANLHEPIHSIMITLSFPAYIFLWYCGEVIERMLRYQISQRIWGPP